MSQQGMPNGLPPNWCGTQPSPLFPPQKNPNFMPHNVNNGVNSSQSSRDSSPATRPSNIPASQLPPQRGNIPTSQLPPGRPGISPIPQNLGAANLNPTNGHGSASVSPFPNITPQSSPRFTNFSTSTPNSQQPNLNQLNPKPNDIISSERTVQQNNPNLYSNVVNKTTNYTTASVVPQSLPSNVVTSQSTPINTRNDFQQQNTIIAQTSSAQPRQENTLSHASSKMQNFTPTARQDLNQPQNIQRPLNSGPQLQQHNTEQQFQATNIQNDTLRNQNQFPQQKPPVIPDTNRQFTTSTVQQQPPQIRNNTGPIQNQQIPPSNNMNYPNQNVRPMMPNMYGSTVQPSQPPPAMGPQAGVNYSQTTPVSNIHANRYPQAVPPPPQQQQNQNTTNLQYSQFSLQSQQPQNQIIPPPVNNYNQIPANTYPQQPSNVYNNQQQYPQPQQQINQQRNYQQMTQQMQNLNVVKSGYNKMWGHDNYDLLQCPNVLPEEAVEAPKIRLGQEYLDAANCNSEIFRCTMTKIPESSSLLQKSRLPLGVLIHPFKDLNHLPVIQCNTIVRCRACRTYINPFIFFVDTKRWKCNMCYRVNELPEEFQYDPVSKSYGDPSRRPEVKSSTIEYIAPSEYMLRPPQPAVYLFLLDISRLAIESGYLQTICEVLSSLLSTLPGDARTQIGFLAYNSTLHFFSLAEGLSQPHEMIVSDIDDVYLPCPDNLLVNLKEHMDLVTDLLTQLPMRYQNSFDNGSVLGSALQAALKLMSSTGGRVTVFQSTLPMLGPGSLTSREDPNQRAGKEAPHLNPATDFYKRLALDCSGHQIAVDLFLLNSQYIDIATLSGVSRFSGGCMYHFPLFKSSRKLQVKSLERCFRRYLTRKIGFEAVMRVRCTRGLAIHTFHGNLFVRSTDLLSLPNVNPDAGFGMQVSIEESLTELQSVCFQAALLYTSSKGERRIRVHTLCLPVVNSLSEVLNSADQQCIVGLLSKMAVDRSLQSSLSDARDAFINVAIDILSSYKLSLNMGSSNNGLLAPQSLKLLPLYILALLKFTAFRTGQSTRLDDRVFAMCDMKTLPLAQLLQNVYPDLYPIYRLSECPNIVDSEGVVIPQPRRLQLTHRNIDSHGAYLLDAGQEMIIYVCANVSQAFLVHTLGVPNYNTIPDQYYELPKLENPDNQLLHAFINHLNEEKPYVATLHIMRDNSPNRTLLIERLIEDRIEFALSYNEFLQHLKTQVK